MTSPENRQKTAIIYVRVKPEVKALLEAQAQAQAQGRTLTNYLEWIARQNARPPQRAPGDTP